MALVYTLVVSAIYWPWYSILPSALLAFTPLRRSLFTVVVLWAGARAIAPLAAGLRPDVGRLANAWATCTLIVILLALASFLLQPSLLQSSGLYESLRRVGAGNSSTRPDGT